jgi:hypothetical protein
MNEQFLMRPGDTFVCDECGCSFMVESGPKDTSMAMQAPQCCCGHQMHKQDSMQADTQRMNRHSEMDALNSGTMHPMMRD